MAKKAVIGTGGRQREIFREEVLLDCLDGDKELFTEIIGEFLRDMPCQLDGLRRALDDKDMEKVERRAHTIKGTSANVGAKALSILALEVEEAGKRNRHEGLRELVASLERGFESLRTVLSRLVRERGRMV